jgi:hypothetical protein
LKQFKHFFYGYWLGKILRRKSTSPVSKGKAKLAEFIAENKGGSMHLHAAVSGCFFG